MDAAPASPAQLDQQRATDRQRAAESAIENDPAIRAFKDMFGASVKPGSVRPLDS
jgi:DNA polymerase III subunit gamma/tau